MAALIEQRSDARSRMRTCVRLAWAAAMTGVMLGSGARADAQTPPAPAPGERFALVVQGVSGDETYATRHRQWLDAMVTVLRDRFKYDAAHLIVLAEKPGANEQRATAEATRAVLTKLAATLKPADQLFIMFIGHGGGEGAEAKFNLVGPDLSAVEWNALLKPVRSRIVLADTTSASFPYLAGLAGPGRVIITATNSFAQRFHTEFPAGFIQAFTAEAADADKNARISLLEAFTYASRLVAQHYEQAGTMATEKALIDDTGDGVGRDAAATGADGTVAGLTYLDAPPMATSSNPEVQQLLQRQQALTEQVDDLRRRKPAMPKAEFDREFERLIIELAVVSRDVRRRSGA